MSQSPKTATRLRASRRTWVLGTLAALAAAIIAIVLLFDWNWLKGPLERRVSDRLGRPFQIAGDLDVDLGLRPRITIHDARLANPPWASKEPMLEVQRAEFVIDLPALWHGRIELPEVSVSKPTLRLETRPDGPPNWRFKPSTGGPVIPEIGQLKISDASLHFLAHGTGQSVAAHLDEVGGTTGAAGENRGLTLTSSGELQGQPLHLKLSGPPAAELQDQAKRYPVALDLQLGKNDVAGDISLALGKQTPALTAKLHSNRIETSQFAGLLGQAQQPPVVAKVRTAAEAAESAAPTVVSRIQSALDKLDFGQLPAADLNLEYDVKTFEAPDLSLHDLQLKTELQDQVPKFALAGQGNYKGQPVTLNVKAGPAERGAPAQGYQVNADIAAGETRITASGATDRPKDLKGLRVQLDVNSPDPTELLRQLGFNVPKLPGLRAKGQITRDGNAWQLADLDAKVGESDLSGSLAADFSGKRPLLSADLRSDRLRASDLMPAQGAEPASEEVRPVVPTAALSLQKLPDVDADLKFQGHDVQLPQVVLKQLELNIKLRDRVAIGDVAGDGTFREYKPIAFEVHAGDDQSLKDPQARYPIDVALHAGDTKASLKGTADHPLDYTGLDADLLLQGPDLQLLGKVLGMPLPRTPPYQLAGKVTHQPDHQRWNLVAIEGKVGDSDLGGDVSLELSGERPTVVADLKSKRLDSDDLGVLVGVPPATGPGQTASPEQRQEAEAQKASPRILPDTPLDITSLKLVDARVSFTGESVRARKVPIQHLSVKLTVENGKVRLEPLRLEVADGELEAKSNLQSDSKALEGKVDLSLKQIKLNELLSSLGLKLAGVNVEKEGAGTFGGGAELNTHGKSLHQLAANAEGEVVMIMDGGQINALIIEALGLDVGEILGLLMTEPKKGASTTVPIQCFVGRFGVHQGVMESQAMVLDTTDSTITGKGQIDLGNETLALELLSHPKDVSVLTASTPIRIEGTLKHPKVSVVSKQLAEKSLAALALGVIMPVVGAVLPFIETGKTKGSNCGRLLADAKAAIPPAAKPSTK